MFHEALYLCKKLVSFPSVTPEDKDLFTWLKDYLENIGFSVEIFVEKDTKNFYAHWTRGRIIPPFTEKDEKDRKVEDDIPSFAYSKSSKEKLHLAFVGHIDVVPPGPLDQWLHDPFEATIGVHEEYGESLYGRGTADMKGALACFIAAVLRFQNTNLGASFSIILTSDEEGSGVHGIRTLVPFLKSKNIDGFIVGEPTGQKIGEVLQVGRRGSLLGTLDIKGIQGHIACPEFFRNPLRDMARCVEALHTLVLDEGTDLFPPSHLEVTSIDTNNPTVNIVPGSSRALFGVRFNPLHTPESLEEKIRQTIENVCPYATLSFSLSGVPYCSAASPFVNSVFTSISRFQKKDPLLTTKGGITDGRWLAPLGPVVELGFPETTIHQVNECITLKDIDTLCNLYFFILSDFFG